MGNIVMKKIENNKEPIINAEFIINKPTNPNEDINEEYIWLFIHTNNKDFIKVQEQGFTISSKVKVDYGYLWMKKKRII